MNATIRKATEEMILEGLKKCTPKQQDFFKRMYVKGYTGEVEVTLSEVVSSVPDSCLDWALTQIENTIVKNCATIKK